MKTSAYQIINKKKIFNYQKNKNKANVSFLFLIFFLVKQLPSLYGSDKFFEDEENSFISSRDFILNKAQNFRFEIGESFWDQIGFLQPLYNVLQGFDSCTLSEEENYNENLLIYQNKKNRAQNIDIIEIEEDYTSEDENPAQNTYDDYDIIDHDIIDETNYKEILLALQGEKNEDKKMLKPQKDYSSEKKQGGNHKLWIKENQKNIKESSFCLEHTVTAVGDQWDKIKKENEIKSVSSKKRIKQNDTVFYGNFKKKK